MIEEHKVIAVSDELMAGNSLTVVTCSCHNAKYSVQIYTPVVKSTQTSGDQQVNLGTCYLILSISLT